MPSPRILAFHWERLEHLTLSAVTLGFALLTIGLVTGLVKVLHGGANMLGPHWLTSPKVILSAAVWIVYALVLHFARSTPLPRPARRDALHSRLRSHARHLDRRAVHAREEHRLMSAFAPAGNGFTPTAPWRLQSGERLALLGITTKRSDGATFAKASFLRRKLYCSPPAISAWSLYAAAKGRNLN